MLARTLAMLLLAVVPCACAPIEGGPAEQARGLNDGSALRPFRVVLVPADGGTADGTKADFEPLFRVIGRQTGLHFKLTVAQSYAAATEAMCGGAAEIGWFGAVSFLQTRARGCAELLAVDVLHGKPTYHAGIFVKRDGPIRSVRDLAGRTLALGDVNSTSSFSYQVAMLLDAGVAVPHGVGKIRLAGSHANSLAALAQGQVDAAAASFDSYEKAVRQGDIDPKAHRVLTRSEAIPNPPLALHPALSSTVKTRLRGAIDAVHLSGIDSELIRGYGGKRVDRYDADFPMRGFAGPARVMARVDDGLKAAILRQASGR